MKTPHHVTRMQKQFLNELASSERPLSEVMDDRGISPTVFASWLISRPFHLLLRKTIKSMGNLRELNIQSAAAKASETLHRLADTDGQRSSPEKRRACCELIRLAREQEQRMRANKKMFEPQRPPLPTLAPMAERNQSDEESKRLFREMVDEHFRETTKSNQSA